jgi:uncharacterized protein
MPDDKPQDPPGGRPLIQYPAVYPFKVIGLKTDDFREHVRQLFRRLVTSDISPDSISEQLSNRGKYVSLTVPVLLLSEDQRQAIYVALHQDRRVLYYL